MKTNLTTACQENTDTPTHRHARTHAPEADVLELGDVLLIEELLNVAEAVRLRVGDHQLVVDGGLADVLARHEQVLDEVLPFLCTHIMYGRHSLATHEVRQCRKPEAAKL